MVDCSNLPNEEVVKTFKQGSALVATQPEKSVHIITNITNCKLDTEITSAVKEYAKANTKYVKESVIVGMNGMHAVIFSLIKALTRRDFHMSDTMDDAIAYIRAL